MIAESDITKIKSILDTAECIAVLQADNPDADSLGSALALEELLENSGKKVVLYCGTDIPSYLSYIEGYDRVRNELPKFDASIIVDASTKTLFQRLNDEGKLAWVASKPCIVLDHHASVQNPIDFAEVSLIDPTAAATGVIIYELSAGLKLKITPQAAQLLMVSILGDTQGLTNNLATPDTYRIMADLLEAGGDRAKLEEKRREQSKMPRKILSFKADLIKKTQFNEQGTIAYTAVNNREIKEFSSLYNPGPLIQGDLLQTTGVVAAIVFKIYDSGRVTASIRCNNVADIANKLAESFGGGGHAYAAGFKQESVKNPTDLIQQVISDAETLLGATE
jgi:bifunctional oligoribonuclease and PAP phosphatase NrnA